MVIFHMPPSLLALSLISHNSTKIPLFINSSLGFCLKSFMWYFRTAEHNICNNAISLYDKPQFAIKENIYIYFFHTHTNIYNVSPFSGYFNWIGLVQMSRPMSYRTATLRINCVKSEMGTEWHRLPSTFYTATLHICLPSWLYRNLSESIFHAIKLSTFTAVQQQSHFRLECRREVKQWNGQFLNCHNSLSGALTARIRASQQSTLSLMDKGN